MRSARPKPLHLLCGRAMVLYVLDALATPESTGPSSWSATAPSGSPRSSARTAPALRLEFVEQHVQRGTGDAVGRRASPAFPDDDLDDDDRDVARAPRRHPAAAARRPSPPSWPSTATPAPRARSSPPGVDDPTGYGRIVRGQRRPRRRGSSSSATPPPTSSTITEINTAIYCFRRSLLAPALRRLTPDNAQGEYYLTDVVEVLADAGHPVVAVVADDPPRPPASTTGPSWPTPRPSCAAAPTSAWLRPGVTMVDPDRTYIDTTVELAADVTLFPGTMLQGRTVDRRGRRDRARHAASSTASSASDAIVEHTVGRDAEIGADCQCRPVRGARAGLAHAVRDPHRAVLHCGHGGGLDD